MGNSRAVTTATAALAAASMTLAGATVVEGTPDHRANATCGKTRVFRGNGGTRLGTIALKGSAVLRWTNDGGVFQLFTSDGVPVNSQAPHGSKEVSGSLRRLQVNALGNWTIRITPRCGSGAATRGFYRFRGNGGKTLPSFTLRRESVLRWTNDGGIFQIFTSDDVPVNSQGRSGTSILDAGTYRGVQVNALGNWTVSIRPR
jgi:hypothetical protein